MGEFLLLVGSMGALAFAVASIELIWRALRDGLSWLRHRAGSRLAPPGFNPSRGDIA